MGWWGSSCGLVLLLGLVGCRPSTARGTLLERDLRAKLPPGVAVPAETTPQQATIAICNDVGPVRLGLRWRTFTHQGIGYVSSYAVDLEKAAGGLEVRLGQAWPKPAPDLPMVMVSMAVFCRSTPLWGDVRDEVAYLVLDPAGGAHTLD